MRSSRGVVAIVIGILGSVAAHGQQSTSIVPTVPTTVRINQTITLTGRVTDAWTGSGLPGRLLNIGVGDQYSYANTYFNTNSSGFASRTWRFNRTGRYRVIFQVDDGFGYLDSRTTVFINVTP